MSIWWPLNPSVQMVKCLPAMQETWVQSLGGEDPLEKEIATHSSILAWRIPWMEEPGGLQSTGSQRVRHDWATSLTHEDLQDLLEATPKKRCPLLHKGWNAKVGSQETPGITGKFGPGVHNEAGERLIEFCQENTLVVANTLFQQHKRRLYMDITRWSILK